MDDFLDELLDKYADWFEHTDDQLERTILDEVLLDLIDLRNTGGIDAL